MLQANCRDSKHDVRLAMNENFQHLVCALARSDTAAAERVLAGPNFDFSAFWEYLREGRLRALATSLLDSEQAMAAAPPRFIRRLVRYRDEHQQRQTKLRDSLSEIDRRFRQDAIDLVTLKGFMLSSRFYPSPDLRQQYDLDILVRQRDLQRSLSSLRALGFCLKRNRTSITSQKIRTEHAVSLTRPDCKVDLHWRLRGFPACRIEEHTIFATARETDFNGSRIRTLSDEYMLTLLMLSIAADLGGGVCRLKHWLDLYLVVFALRHESDWMLFFQAREREGVLSLCVNVLSLLRQLFAHDERLSWIDDVLLPFRELICVSDTRQATALVFARRGAISNAMWLLRTYPSIGWRELVWFLDRNLPHPGRIPTAGFRSARFVWRAACWQLATITGRR